jgi:HEAT repeat protein
MKTSIVPKLCLLGALFGWPTVMAQPPAKMNPPAAAPKDIAVPNSPSFPSHIGGHTLEEWIKDIDSPDPSIREQAMQTVLAFGPAARKAIPAITRQVKQLNDIGPQSFAIMALADLIPTTAGAPTDKWIDDAIRALISVVDSPQAVIRFRAATTLGYLGPQARAAVRDLIPRVTDRSSWEIRKAACFALGAVGRDDLGYPLVDAQEALAKGVTDRESRGVRLEAIQSVIRLGAPAPGKAVPQLVNALKQRMAQERDRTLLIWVRVAALALVPTDINEKSLVPIVKEMKSPDADVRSTAIRAIGLMGPAAKFAVQDLIDALTKSTDPATTVELCAALGRMGEHAERAIGALTQVHAQDNTAVKTASEQAIADIHKAMDEAKKQPKKPPA